MNTKNKTAKTAGASQNCEIEHEESGCTDYLQHPWESCPENKGKNDPNLNWAMYNPGKANPTARGKPELPNDECESCGADIGHNDSFPWHNANEDCRAIRQPQAPHSPLPWEHNATQPFTRYDGEREDGYARAIWQGDNPICTTEFSVGKYKALSPAQQDANARLIVASVNHAQALAEALRDMLSLVDDLGLTTSTTRDKAREALANWEGAK